MQRVRSTCMITVSTFLSSTVSTSSEGFTASCPTLDQLPSKKATTPCKQAFQTQLHCHACRAGAIMALVVVGRWVPSGGEALTSMVQPKCM